MSDSTQAWEQLASDRTLPRLESQLGAVPEALKRYLEHKKMPPQFYNDLPDWKKVNWQRQAFVWYTRGTDT